MGFRTPFYDKNRKLMFHSIINLEPNFPPYFSVAAKSVLLKLLHKDSLKRLGSNGAHEIKMTGFFAPLNFQKLLASTSECLTSKCAFWLESTDHGRRREITPPFKPEVSNEEDTKYVPKTYLSAKPEDSVDHSASKQKHTQHFQGFTFNPSQMWSAGTDDKSF